MYERHKRRYSLCAKGERAVDVVLIKPRSGCIIISLWVTITCLQRLIHCSSCFLCRSTETERRLVSHATLCNQINEAVTGGDSASELSVSCSSADDTASIGPSSSSPEGSHWGPEERLKAGPSTPDSTAGDPEEEAKDRVTEVPRRSCLLRNSRRSISPLRRHSWGPGKNYTGDVEMNRR
ncbi:hypothetical protein WMY93_013756 [Mugilogobius chulae]|uniref:Uncharacterized protein n=1 Tax=Mugilogobius chulae TaxID=88201 RepID=A0AAW0P9Z8_9GOBI